mmetsp:Transcript_55354/g.63272  ORF Transcript_55354/g.63272 Transcript_55354/m.63272 type:complete len:181 (-) Transcript_55354:371-913(-)|eukprot:CAMPEP_0115005532 /NCGR_PEP_ID=MMETSP0216-20121206/19930_1 /TAXON_ID=223996 /ORGANISM="Protocruzia adherens, Strain Boccale" /LENGTH=180 /DNA_ID=CAMNT_0002371881 /DNA_START=42 /DNA_END=584 /DNA_ORIENTATION=-
MALAESILQSAQSYPLKLTVFYCLLITDIALNSVWNYVLYEADTDSIGNYDKGSEQVTMFFVFIIQVVLQFVIFAFIFFLIWKTFLFRYALMWEIWDHFYALFITFLLNFIFLMAERLYKLNNTKEDDIAVFDIWKDSGYLILFYIKNLLSIAFYFFSITSSLKLGHPVYYKPKKWLEDC